MVDWGLGGRGEMHVPRMHAAARHPGMLQEEEAELNVMDFVETEYKADLGEGEQGRPSLKRKKVSARLQGCQGKRSNAGTPRRVLGPPADGGKTAHKRRKRKHAQRPGEASPGAASLGLHYPYAAFLKKLCDQVGSSQGGSESLPSRIFHPLRHTEVHYPYASLLQALHRHAGVGAGGASSPSSAGASPDRPPGTLEVARVMRNLRYPVASHRHDGRDDAGDPVTPFSAVLMAMVMQEKLRGYTASQGPSGYGCSVGGIGEILRKEMPRSKKDDPPPSELSSASLLQKLSLSAEREGEATKGSASLPGAQQLASWSSTESSHSEEDDLDWRPTHWLAKKVSKDSAAPVKRKSIRKKSLSQDSEQEQPNTALGDSETVRGGNSLVDSETVGGGTSLGDSETVRGGTSLGDSETVRGGTSLGESVDGGPARTTRLQQRSASEAARAKLLQFIMSRQQGVSEKRNKRARKRAKVTRKKGKRKRINNAQTDSIPWDTEVTASGLTEGQTTATEGGGSRPAPGESQSLLKEYLLKPAGEEVTPSENCDIPKLETSFLFSRLLLNFKTLAESNQPDEPSKRTTESSHGPSILRGMLASGTPLPTTDDYEQKFCPSDHQNTSSSSEQQQQQQPCTPPSLDEPLLRVKVDQAIKVECEEEEIVCKVECEEDGFECHVCHLQFSSLSDLSNHQVLFHCSEEPPQTPASHRLLGCSVEGLAGGGGVLQGKQPA